MKKYICVTCDYTAKTKTNLNIHNNEASWIDNASFGATTFWKKREGGERKRKKKFSLFRMIFFFEN